MLNTKLYFYILLIMASYSVEAKLQCDQWVAKTLSAQGQVEKKHRHQDTWQPVGNVEFFCQGDKIRTLNGSRAILKFINEPKTIIELQQNSALTFPTIESNPKLPFFQFKKGSLDLAYAIQFLKQQLILI